MNAHRRLITVVLERSLPPQMAKRPELAPAPAPDSRSHDAPAAVSEVPAALWVARMVLPTEDASVFYSAELSDGCSLADVV